MKKIIAFIIIGTVIAAFSTGCNNNASTPTEAVTEEATVQKEDVTTVVVNKLDSADIEVDKDNLPGEISEDIIKEKDGKFYVNGKDLIDLAKNFEKNIVIASPDGYEYTVNYEKQMISRKKIEAKDEVNFEVKEFSTLAEEKVVVGIDNYKVEQGTVIDFDKVITVNKDLVTDVKVDDSKVDYNTPGDYEAIITITYDNEKVKKYEEEKKVDLGLPKETDKIVTKTKVTVTVLDKEDAKKATENNENVITAESEAGTIAEETKKEQENKTEAPTQQEVLTPALTQQEVRTEAPTQAPTKGSTQQAHQHNWVEQTKTVHHDEKGHWETKTVVDQEAWDETIPGQIVGYKDTIMCSECGRVYVGTGDSFENAQMAAADELLLNDPCQDEFARGMGLK